MIKTLSAKIEKLVPGGQGIATLENGKKAFIWSVLPGEEVVFYTTKNKKSYCEGIATEIIKPSSHRVSPKDDCYLSTSPWQIFDYNYELEQKSLLVQESFRQNKIDLKVPLTISDGKDYYYRNKMEYSLYWDNDQNKILPAFHQRGSHRKIPLTQSSIERPEIFQAVQTIIDNLNAKNEEARKYQSILIRCNQSGEISSALFENGKPHPKMKNLSDTILCKKYSYSPNGFFQINIPVYEMVLEEIKKHIDTKVILDLYAGVGTIGLSVADQDMNLTLVESNEAAFSELSENCNTRLAKPVLDKSENVPGYIQPDQTVILDPPRAGCDEKLLETLNQKLPQKVIYLSCNPITQARDIAKLIQNYEITKIQPYNFFPHTPHIENLVVLSLRTKN